MRIVDLELNLSDRLTPEQRSANMAKIKRAHTKPEMIVRRLLHGSGYRFRIQWRAAPGRPDVAFPGRKAIIFVHGCFWHQHSGCQAARVPTARRNFWIEKFRLNRARDDRNLAQADAAGWRSLVIWECETKDLEALADRLEKFLGPVRLTRSPGKLRD